jgi:hypothetical protein
MRKETTMTESLLLTPNSGPAGSSIQVLGQGYPRGHFQITWDGSPTGMPNVRTSGSRTGKLSAIITAPAGAAAGQHVIAAGDGSSIFTVTAQAAPNISAAVTLPAAPAAYALPTGAILVSTAAELITALSGTTPRDLVLANGIYDNSQPFYNPNGHRLWAATLLGAQLKAGLSLGGNWGPGGGAAHGIAFDVATLAKSFSGHAVATWGTGRNSRVEDCTIEGHSVIASGIFAAQADGLVLRRIVAQHFTDYGVALTPAGGVPSVKPIVEDIDARYVARAIPGSADGTAEACIWIGVPASVRRIRGRDAGWMALWTGSDCQDSIFEDITLDGAPHAGHYVEHFTKRCTFSRFNIGPTVATGINYEWDDGIAGNGASYDNVHQDGRIETTLVGAFMDQGTTRTTIRRTTFVGQSWACIGNYMNSANGNLYDTTGNDYSGKDGGAVDISTDHVPN